MKTLAVTGYKAHELGIFTQKHQGISFIKKALKKRFIQFSDEGLEWIIISGQLGVELWAAETALDLDLKVAVLTPFMNQEKNWNDQTKEFYHSVLERADYVNSISQKEYESPLQLKMKNQFIIDKSDGLLVLYDEEKGGSPNYYIQPAKKRHEMDGYEIHMITPYDIELIVEEARYDQYD